MTKVDERIEAYYRDTFGREPTDQERRIVTGWHVVHWLGRILGEDVPAGLNCEKLPRACQIAINRDWNAKLMQAVELVPGNVRDIVQEKLTLKLKDISPGEDQAYRDLQEQVAPLLAKVRALKDVQGNCCWPGNGDVPDLFLEDVTRVLLRISAGPPAAPTRSDRRLASWHEVGRRVACLIMTAMREVDYKGSMAPASEEGATAHLGADIISHAFNLTIDNSAFAKAMARHGPDTEDCAAAQRIWDELARLYPR
jgi:hypothetical protein